MFDRRFAAAATVCLVAWGCGEEATDSPTGLTSDLAADAPVVVQSGAAIHAPVVIGGIQAVDLGTLDGGTESTARDISDGGDIVGWSGTTVGEDHAFLLTAAGFTDLGTLPGGDFSRATGLNELGQVVGSARNDAGVIHAFVWEAGVLTDLGAFPPEDDIGSSSGASAINASGIISGSIDLAGGYWDLSGTPNFPPFPPFTVLTPDPFTPTVGRDLNDAGQIVGAMLSQGTAFIWEAGVLQPLPGFVAFDDVAFGVNAAGVAVGRALMAPPIRRHAVLWPDPATIVDLGTLGGENSTAFDINDDGWVVGESETDTGETVAFLWTEELGMQSLGTLGGANSSARAINSAGQIVGESETADGDTHAALWTVTVATEVIVDIKPGSDPNSVNPRSKGVIPVAILSDAHFDATTVDPLSVRFGPDEAEEAHRRGHVEDVDGDGIDDLMLHFRTQETGIHCGTTEATLTGVTTSGESIRGTDSVRTVGCR